MKNVKTIRLGPEEEFCIREYGSGSNVWIAFHGFGKTGVFFEPLGQLPNARILAPDLPFHGRTSWKRKTFSTMDLIDLIGDLRREMGFSRFQLVGHSMGARFALASSAGVLPWLEGLYLIGPDGLVTSGMGWLDKTPGPLIRGIEKWTVRSDGWVRLVHMLHKAGLLSRQQWLFCKKQLADPANRARLFASWQALKEASSSIRVTREVLGRTPIRVGVAWGREDPFIQEKRLWKWLGGIPQLIPFLYDGGHEPNWEQLIPFLENISV